MAFSGWKIFCILLCLSTVAAQSPLRVSYYKYSCPQLLNVVEKGVENALKKEPRLAASLLRLHFHDCFVNGCDGSVLLDDTATFVGEKTALPNINSIRGFDAIDSIKASVETACPRTVSCADITALAARDSVARFGGPNWDVPLGRRDARTASKADANRFLPSPFMNIAQLQTVFAAVGLTANEMVVLSGGHTLGKAQCGAFTSRLFNFSGTGKPDPTISLAFLATLQKRCPQGGDLTVLNNLDGSTNTVDISYYQNLQCKKGLLSSDQILYTTAGLTKNLVSIYAHDQDRWFADFSKAMIKMGNMKPLTGYNGEIRKNCRFVN